MVYLWLCFLREGGKGEVGSEFLKRFLNYKLSDTAEGHASGGLLREQWLPRVEFF